MAGKMRRAQGMANERSTSNTFDAKVREILQRVEPFVSHFSDEAKHALVRRMAEIELKYQGRSGPSPPSRAWK